jgi:fucose permease
MSLLTAMMVALLFIGGMGVALLGSLKVTLAERLKMEETRVGGLASLFGFVMIPVIFSAGFLADAIGQQIPLVAGSVLFAAALLVLAAARTYPAALLAVVMLSAGWSLLIIVGNPLSVKAFPGFAAQATNLANFFFGLGAFLTPLLLALLLRRTSWWTTLLVPAVLALMPGLLTLGITFEPPTGSAGDFTTLLRDPVMWLCGLCLFFYGPLEASMGMWTTTYLGERGVSEGAAAAWLSGFWLAFMAARLATSLAVQAGHERLLLVVLALAITVVLVGLVVNRQRTLAPALIVAAGLVLGPFFPTMIGILLHHVAPTLHGRAVGLLFAVGGVGWTILPILLGAYASRTSVQRGFTVAVGAGVGLLAVTGLLLRQA